ncbi:HD domain-containing protein [Microvirga thermotolerans]|uniref:HD domain-containing protein n=1 Tax=Microvirga thermotolerans TaxID=2651334 RepID=A0A5P9K2W3_9HYPH|nr:HD domain-containing protein [Microvirga thermotolerans]QFU16574.1 HD domain-containing protein [Microvirga thermotolerans]
MSKLTQRYSVRDPIHGMIDFNALEWDVINSEPFQRLRRIKQLAWTDYVYPGAMHTRFEHSLGVCHTATRLFDSISKKDAEVLRSDHGFDEAGLLRQRQIIRLAALTHDLGHGPLSHAAEECFPFQEGGEKRYVHEQYSASFVRHLLADIIENHPANRNNYAIKYADISSMFDGSHGVNRSIVWKEIISGQMDADRMDYLLRDSYHAGVSYGRYDLDRVINTVCLCEDDDGSGHVIGIEDDGIHAVEGLLIARYMMFTQVYFHKTRVIYDYHYDKALQYLLRENNGLFPPPTKEGILEYMKWDDWRVLHSLAADKDDENCRAIQSRNHYRLIYSTPECPDLDDLAKFDAMLEKLDGLGAVVRDATKSWYKYQKDEIRLRENSGGKLISIPLATRSPVVNGLQTVNQRRIYASPQVRAEALKRLGS